MRKPNFFLKLNNIDIPTKSVVHQQPNNGSLIYGEAPQSQLVMNVSTLILSTIGILGSNMHRIKPKPMGFSRIRACMKQSQP
jgi:hypothetical protein